MKDCARTFTGIASLADLESFMLIKLYKARFHLLQLVSKRNRSAASVGSGNECLVKLFWYFTPGVRASDIS